MTKEIFSKLPILKKSDRILLLTHTDMDGSGAAILLKSLFENVVVKHCSNSVMSYSIRDSVSNADDFDKIVACDISCSDSDAQIINQMPGKSKLILLDHHASAVSLNQYRWAVVEPAVLRDSYRAAYFTEKNGLSSGTSLLYDYLEFNGNISLVDSQNDTAKKIVDLIATYDTWDWINCFGGDLKYKNYNSLFEIYGQELFESRCIEKIIEGEPVFDSTDNMMIGIENIEVPATYDSSLKWGILLVHLPLSTKR